MLSNRDNIGKIKSYAKYTTLEDRRVLAIVMAERLYIRRDDSPKILLEYILNKKKYIEIMKKRFKEIKKQIEVNNDR